MILTETPPTSNQITEIYYVENIDDLILLGSNVENLLPDLFIVFNVSASEAIYVNFDCIIVLATSSTPLVLVGFLLDGNPLLRYTIARDETGIVVADHPTSLQYYNDTLTPGQHAISVYAKTPGPDFQNYITMSALMLQIIII